MSHAASTFVPLVSRDTRPSRAWLLAAGFVVLVSTVLLVTTGNPMSAIGALIVAAVLLIALLLPLRYTLLTLTALAVGLEFDPTQWTLAANRGWYAPLRLAYALLFDNLNNVLPIEALRFSLTELLFVGMIAVAIVRQMSGARTDRAGRGSGSNVMYALCLLSLGAVLWLELWGVGVRGGDFRQSLWQFREVFWLPVLTCLFSYCLRGNEDLLLAIRMLLVVVCVKIAIAGTYLALVVWPANEAPTYITTHNDSLPFVFIIVALVAAWAHAPSWRRLWIAAGVGGWILFGIVVNGRRLAFVSLFIAIFMLYLQLRGKVKRRLTMTMLACSPIGLLYVLAGRNHTSGFFKVAGLISSVTRQSDASSATREIENTNLLHTFRQSRILGTGWGHEYIEMVKAYDISQYFAQYRFIAHNSVLWLWSIGGVLGFTLLWLPLAAGVFMARRAYLFARTPEERTGAIISMTILVAYMIQAWGDMGTQGMTCAMLAAMALASSAKLVVATGGLPARIRLFGHTRVTPPPAVAVAWERAS